MSYLLNDISSVYPLCRIGSGFTASLTADAVSLVLMGLAAPKPSRTGRWRASRLVSPAFRAPEQVRGLCRPGDPPPGAMVPDG